LPSFFKKNKKKIKEIKKNKIKNKINFKCLRRNAGAKESKMEKTLESFENFNKYLLTPDKVGGWSGEFLRDTKKYLVFKIEDKIFYVPRSKFKIFGYQYNPTLLKHGQSVDVGRVLLFDEEVGSFFGTVAIKIDGKWINLYEEELN